MKFKSFAIAFAIAVIAVCLATPGLGQTVFGTILGTVTDVSGAVVPNVVITVTNQGENVSRDVRSDAQGNYQAENMKAGLYTVSAIATGFKDTVLTDVRLDARQTVRADMKLTVGSAAEKVTVEANAELVNTESEVISANVTSTEVLGLPANYRGAGSTSPYKLLAFLPGVTGDDDGNISVQGTGTNQVEYTIDGINTQSVRFSGPQREMFPSAESISEMKVQGAGGGAEYGGAADITTTSKSGTNVFHGSAFEYFQNAALDATRFTVPQVIKPPKSANTFGGSIGGPLFGKHTFFFGDYEGMRYRTQTALQETVPNQAMRNGDFSGFLGVQVGLDPKGRPVFQNEVFDPDTTVIMPGPFGCGPPPNPNPCSPTPTPDGFGFDPVTGLPIPGQANIVPTSRFDPRAPAILKFYPLPIQGGVDNFARHNHTLNVPNPILSD